MSAKWTKGPWLIDPNNGAYIVGSEVDLDAHGDPAYPEVCELSHSYHEDANARLIAAAPDLAEVLKNLVGLAKMRGTLTGYGAAIADAEAALAKAGAT